MKCEKCVKPEQLRILLERGNLKVSASRCDTGFIASVQASTDERSTYQIGNARNQVRVFKTFDALVSYLERMGGCNFSIAFGG